MQVRIVDTELLTGGNSSGCPWPPTVPLTFGATLVSHPNLNEDAQGLRMQLTNSSQMPWQQTTAKSPPRQVPAQVRRRLLYPAHHVTPCYTRKLSTRVHWAQGPLHPQGSCVCSCEPQPNRLQKRDLRSEHRPEVIPTFFVSSGPGSLLHAPGSRGPFRGEERTGL